MEGLSRSCGLVAAAVVVCLAVGCDTAERAPLSWPEFRAGAYREPDTGIYIIDGDEPAASDAELAEAYRRYRADAEQGRVGQEEEGLIVDQEGGEDDRWDPDQAMRLTYCVSADSFGDRHYQVERAMSAAVRSWESAARVDFVHLSGEDDRCTADNDDVLFDVREVCRGAYLARSFFPKSERRAREVVVDCTSFEDLGPITLSGVLRHELGHVLGFRHEHTRPEAGTCFEDDSWRPLTEYDPASVMHYPQCGGTNDGDLVLTDLDREGAAELYP